MDTCCHYTLCVARAQLSAYHLTPVPDISAIVRMLITEEDLTKVSIYSCFFTSSSVKLSTQVKGLIMYSLTPIDNND